MLNNLMEAVFGPGFVTRSRRIARETGWRQLSDNNYWALFEVPFGGHQYELWVQNCEPIVKFSLMSHGRFALRLYPPVLEDVLMRRNQQLDRFAWMFFDASRTTWARLCCSLDLASWNTEVTRSLMKEMLPEVHRYDSGLRAKGLM